MITEKSTQQELIKEIDNTFLQFIDMISMLNNDQINQIPYENSWTAGQLSDHITKSTNGIIKAMKIEAKPAERNMSKRVNELKTTFLDLSNKMKSPEEIVPDKGPFEKEKVINDLRDCYNNLNLNSKETNLNELIEGLPLGSITKYELLHFVLYHSQRHLSQMKRIYEAVII